MSDDKTKYLIDLRKVSKVFQGPAGDIHALRQVNLNVESGEFVGVRGPSGSGKSTLLNMITGIDRPTDGEVTIAEQPLLPNVAHTHCDRKYHAPDGFRAHVETERTFGKGNDAP
jgi:ABC-type lipoprotein export system ATPase subunit